MNKRECKGCHEYSRDGIKTNSGYFCNAECIKLWRNETLALKVVRQNEKNREITKEIIANKKTKKGRENLAKRKKALKTSKDYKKELTIWVHKYVRFRDYGNDCISCNKPFETMASELAISGGLGGLWDAGHYLSVGSSDHLRFNVLQIHGQCKKCNAGEGKGWLNKEVIKSAYRVNLIEKIGLDLVLKIESDHKAKKYYIDEYKRLIVIFKKKAKREERRLKNLDQS